MDFITLYNSCAAEGCANLFVNFPGWHRFLNETKLGYDYHTQRLIEISDDYILHGMKKGRYYIKKDMAVTDPITGFAYTKEELHFYAYHKDNIVRIASETTMQCKACKFHRNGLVYYYKNPIRFLEHSGAGFGEVKKFTQPTGEAYGIEIECCIDGDDIQFEQLLLAKTKLCEEIYNRLGWIVERDGSLEDGVGKIKENLRWGCMEIVSPPLSYDKLIRQLAIAVEILQKFKATSKYGDFFAIHITTNVPNTAQQVKMLSNVMLEENRFFWLKASGRASFSGFVPSSNRPYCQFLNIDGMSPEDKLHSCGSHGHSSDHYRAMFVRNSSAVELRIFKTKVDLDWIMGIVQLNRCLYLHSRDTSEITFLNFVKEKREENPTLNNFLTLNGL